MRLFSLLFLFVNLSYSAKFVAVLETLANRNIGVSSDELRYLTDELRKQALNALPTSAGFSVMTRENILAMLPPGKTLEECAGECMVETGRNLNADFVAQARLGKVGSRLALTVELYETRGAKLVASYTERCAGIDDLIDKVSQQSPALFGKVSGKSDPKQRTEGNSQTAREGTREEAGTNELDLGEAPVLVRIESTPAGAVAMVDGKLACSATPCGKTLSAGPHRIQFGLERYLDTTLEVSVRSGMPKVAVKLVPGWGTLDIATSPTGQPVQVNGKDQGASPLHLELSPGIYELALGNDCMRRKTVTVNLARGQSRQVSETLVAREAGLSLQATDAKTGEDLAARVFVDGKQVGETPYVGKVSTCAQTIEVEADAYPRTKVKVQLTEGKKTQATVKLEQGFQGMAPIPAGCFQMGEPIKKVRLALLSDSLSNAKGYIKPMVYDCLGVGCEPRMIVAVGVFVEPIANGPASKAGLMAGDFLLSINGIQVESADMGINETGKALEQGNVVAFKIMRKNSAGSWMDKKIDVLDWVLDENTKPHEVCLSRFLMDKTEVTMNQYQSVMGTRPWENCKSEYCTTPQNDLPAYFVDWNNASDYCAKIGKRLPTEAEFEYANRAGSTTKFPWGNNENSVCNYANVADQSAKRKWKNWTIVQCDDGYPMLAPAGRFQPNAWGLFDMTGNVWEWTSDWYAQDYYGKSPRQDPKGASSGSYMVNRGGGWLNDEALRSALRNGSIPSKRGHDLGFRCVLY
jgi:formylglycine-generating enzyme required for sulfatase activity